VSYLYDQRARTLDAPTHTCTCAKRPSVTCDTASFVSPEKFAVNRSEEWNSKLMDVFISSGECAPIFDES